MLTTVSLLVLALSGQSTLGKTDAEILKMGRSAWYDYYVSKEGDSTADSCNAEQAFGEVLKRRNDRLLQKTPTKRALIHKVRTDLKAFQSAVYDVGYALSGGGTMWNVVYAGVLADTEETVGHLLGARDPKVKPRKTSEVKQALAALAAKVAREKASIEAMPSGGGMKAARTGLATATRSLNRLISTAAKRPRTESDAILFCCMEAVETFRAYLGEGS